jgi:hypothetical protein
MQANVRETAYEGGHPVSEPIGLRTPGEELLLMFGDEFDMLLQVTLHRKYRLTVGHSLKILPLEQQTTSRQ